MSAPRVEPIASPRPGTLIGVTGTNGKTTTTTLLSHLLRALGRETLLCTSLETRIAGEPHGERRFSRLMELSAELALPFGVCEMTSQALGRGMSIRTPFDVAVLTNFTRDHLETHETPERYLAAKASLFATLRTWPPGEPRRSVAVFNGEDAATPLVLLVTPPGVRRVTFGFAAAPTVAIEADCEHLWAADVEVAADGSTFTLHAPGLAAPARLHTPLVGRHMVANVLAAFGVLHGLDVPLPAVFPALGAFGGVAGRLERVPGPADAPAVYVDFAHTPDGLAQVLRAARALTGPEGRVWLVFGAPGGYDPGKRPEMGAIAAAAADRVVITTDNPRNERPADIARHVRSGATGDHVRVVLDREVAIRTTIGEAAPGDVVLVAGKGHETTQLVGREHRPFSDVEAATRGLAGRRPGGRQPP